QPVFFQQYSVQLIVLFIYAAVMSSAPHDFGMLLKDLYLAGYAVGSAGIIAIHEGEERPFGMKESIVFIFYKDHILFMGNEPDTFVMQVFLDALHGSIGRGIIGNNQFPIGISLVYNTFNCAVNKRFHIIAYHDYTDQH